MSPVGQVESGRKQVVPKFIFDGVRRSEGGRRPRVGVRTPVTTAVDISVFHRQGKPVNRWLGSYLVFSFGGRYVEELPEMKER